MTPTKVEPDGADAEQAAPDFPQIFKAELGYVWNALRRLGVAERDRPDVAHDVFVAIHRHLATYDSTRPLRPWLFAFAVRCASDYRRRAPNRFEVLGSEDEPLVQHAADGAPRLDEALNARTLLAKGLERLDEDKRAVIILHEIEGWSVGEIAAALALPTQTVYSRVRAGREELAAALRRFTNNDKLGGKA